MTESSVAITTLVVPAFNEAKRLNATSFRAFLSANPSVNILFVDDGSTDATITQLEQVRAASPTQVSILRLPGNTGKAEAVRRGMLAAFENGPEYIGYWDADLATPLDAVTEFVALLDSREELAVAIGSRVKLLGRVVERRAARHYLGRVFATAASLTLRLPVYDTQCGAKLFRVTPRLKEVFAVPFIARWIFDVEVLARLSLADAHGVRIDLERAVYEVPLHAWRDQDGSKRTSGDLFRAAVDLFRIRQRYGLAIRTARRPDGRAIPTR